MTTVELLEGLRDAIKNDSTLKSWCQSEFGKDPTIYLGLDVEKIPPPASEYPVISIIDIFQSMGELQKEIKWEIAISVGINQEEILIEENTKTYKGFLQVQRIRELVEEALYRSKIITFDIQGNASGESYHPQYISYSRISGTALKTTRQALPVF